MLLLIIKNIRFYEKNNLLITLNWLIDPFYDFQLLYDYL